MRRLLALALVAALAPAAPAADEHETPRAKVGEMLPDVRLPTIDGQRTVRLGDLRGKKLLLIEFASW